MRKGKKKQVFAGTAVDFFNKLRERANVSRDKNTHTTLFVGFRIT